jgi:predicted phosphodiesterase
LRFAVFSDVQANLPALQSVLNDIEQISPAVDAVVCAGDIVGVGPQPNEVIALLRAKDIPCVLGNYDDATVHDRIGSGVDFATLEAEEQDLVSLVWTRRALSEESRAFLLSLPRDLRLSPGGRGTNVRGTNQDEKTAEYRRMYFLRALFGGLARTPVSFTKRVLVVHATRRALNEVVKADTAASILASVAREAEADLVISGHARSSFRRDAHNITFVGVGPVSGSTAQYAMLDVGQDVEVQFREVRYDVDAYQQAVDARAVAPS